MTVLPEELGRFTFVRVASLRAAQLIRGCTPRVTASVKATTTAQREIKEGKVFEAREGEAVAPNGEGDELLP